MWAQAPQYQWAALAKRWDRNAGGDLWLLSHKFPNTLFMSISNDPAGGNSNIGREFLTPIYGGEWMHLIVTYDQGTVHVYRDGLNDDGPVRGPMPATLSARRWTMRSWLAGS